MLQAQTLLWGRFGNVRIAIEQPQQLGIAQVGGCFRMSPSLFVISPHGAHLSQLDVALRQTRVQR